MDKGLLKAFERYGKYPVDEEEILYCDITGKPFDEGAPYYYVSGDFLCEEIHEIIFDEEEWSELHDNYSDDFYYSEVEYGGDVIENVPESLDYSNHLAVFKKDGKVIGNIQEIAHKVINDEPVDGIKNVGDFLKNAYDNYSYGSQDNLDNYLAQYDITSEYPNIEPTIEFEIE